MEIWDFVYRYFEKPGKKILKIYPNIADDIRKSGIHLYPEVYASFIVFATFLISLISIILSIVFFALHIFIIIPVFAALPFIAFIILVYTPALIGSSRAGGIEGEFPYTVAYLSMMVMSGLSPYTAFERITRSKRVFSKSAELSQRFILLVRVLGRDPLTAFSMLAQRTPSTTVRDLLMGYVTTVRAGGDVIDYLTKKARLLFSELLVRMKIIADRLGGLLEAYLALILLSLISLTVMYYVTVSYVSALTFGVSPGAMALILYVLMPFISGMIIYLVDVTQYKEPWIDYRPYILYGGLSIPLTVYFSVFGILLYELLPPYSPLYRSFLVSGLNDILTLPARMIGLQKFYYPAVAFTMALLFATLPSAIYAEYLAREYRVINGITRFLRDLVEIRKTGLSPERSIIELSKRSYGVFTKYLKKMALQISLGIPLSKIIDELFKKIIVWRAKVMLFIMTDTIEVGGGSIEIMEHLSWFAENVDAIEDEKKRNLRTLLIVPYMGAILTIATIIMMTAFFASLQVATSGAYYIAASSTLPAIILNIYLMGLVAGKVSSGSIAAGFKHAVLLLIISLLFMLAAPIMSKALSGLTGVS